MNSHQDDHNKTTPKMLQEFREFLEEVVGATVAQDDSPLHSFATIVCQIIDLVEDELLPSDAAGQEAAEFVSRCVDEIRRAIDSDVEETEQLASLSNEAIDRWGEYLDIEPGFGNAEPAAMDSWALASDDFDSMSDDHDEGDSDFAAPSAEEISSLMARISTSEAAAAPPHVVDRAEPKSPFADDEPPIQDGNDSEPDSTTIDSLDSELREAFLDDATGCVSSIENELLKLDSDSGNRESLNQICRELHTLKGASASVGLSSLADQLHRLEDRLVEDLKQGRTPDVDDLLRESDSVRSQIFGTDAPDEQPFQQQPEVASPDSSQPERPASSKPAAEPTAPLATPISSTPAAAASFQDVSNEDETIRVKSSQLTRLMDMLAELVMLRNRRENEVAQLQEVYHDLICSVSKMRLLCSEGQVQSAATKSVQLSELANDVLEVAHHVRDCGRPVADGNAAVSQFIRQFRQELVELRRTPISGLFQRLQRVVRDAAQAESKKVNLKLVGEDAGIERSLQQRLYEPLLHIVRNSVCHGIESPEARTEAGKQAAGTITVKAETSPDLFVIEIQDDGRGLDYDAIRRRGLASGLLSPAKVASEEELAQLIFKPGFSTRESANQVAGRGVGMDVVATTLNRMRGWLDVDSTPGQGTRIRLSFPLPSVIEHAMVFRAANQLFAIPMQTVRSAGAIASDTACLALSEVLESPSGLDALSSQGIEVSCDMSSGGGLETGTSTVTLVVDEIVGPEEVVVRSLPSLLRHHPFCSGATHSGMGETVLFLDPRRLIENQVHLIRFSTELFESTEDGTTDSGIAPHKRPSVLVVDDSRSARKRVVRSLERYSVDIVEACDGKEALDTLRTQSFAAIFSDMEMPNVSGMELLAQVQASDDADAPPVVIISSRREDEFTHRAAELGATEYLFKPLADEALDGAIEKIPALAASSLDLPLAFEAHGETI